MSFQYMSILNQSVILYLTEDYLLYFHINPNIIHFRQLINLFLTAYLNLSRDIATKIQAEL